MTSAAAFATGAALPLAVVAIAPLSAIPAALAAASLVSLGLSAGDLEGGIHAWREAGLPVTEGGTPVEQVVPA